MPAAMRDDLETLKAIQNHDQQVRSLQATISSFEAHIHELQQSLAAEVERVEGIKLGLSELQRQSRECNAEVDDLDAQLRKYQHELDTGLISFKEMEALRTKVTHDRERMEHLEDEALALMDRAEAEAKHLKQEEESLAALKTQIAQEIQTVELQIATGRSRIADEQAARATLAQKASSLLLDRYERLAHDYPDPIAAIVNGSCAGCKLKLSETTISRTREGLDIVTCENCARILYSLPH
jgi:predicted  nucleic acid-binding Zn-ribbon protein